MSKDDACDARIRAVEEHLNKVANEGVEGGAEAIRDFMNSNLHKNPYIRLATLTGAILSMIPIEVLVKESSWDEETIKQVLTLLYAGIGAELALEDPKDMINKIINAIEGVAGKGCSLEVVPIKLKEGETVESFIKKRAEDDASTSKEEVWTNVKIGPESTH